MNRCIAERAEDRVALSTYVDTLYGRANPSHFIELRSRVGNGRMAQRFFPVSESAEAIDAVLRESLTSDVYLGVAPRMRRRGKAVDVERSFAVWADCDETASLKALKGFAPTPTMVVSSGKGRHAYWVLAEGGVAAKTVVSLNRRIARVLGSDAKATDAPRILRPPGTQSFKYDTPRQVRLESHTGELFDLKAFEGMAAITSPARVGPRVRQSMRSDHASPILKSERNTQLVRIAGGIRRAGCSQVGLRAALHAENLHRARPPVERHELDAWIDSMAGWPATANPLDKPATFVGDRGLSAVAKLVLVDLVERADHEGFVAQVGMRRLGLQIGESTTTVQRAVKELQEADRIEIIRRKPRSRNAYRITGFSSLLRNDFP